MPPAPPPDPSHPAPAPVTLLEILALADGTEYTSTVRGHCMRPAGVFDGDTIILRRQDHAHDGQIVTALYPGQPPSTRVVGLKHYYQAGGRVRLATADRRWPPMVFDREQVLVLGVLVGVDGTVVLSPESDVVCPIHRRFFRPDACPTCAVLGHVPRRHPRPAPADPAP